MVHVHGHLDQYLPLDLLTSIELLNCECDKLAGIALDEALLSGQFISRVFPGEDLVVLLDGDKLSGSYERSILRDWGDK